MSRFADAALRLYGHVGRGFGWSPDAFWAATPVELVALIGTAEPPAASLGGDELTRLMEAHPDG